MFREKLLPPRQGVELTVELVAAYVSNNSVLAGELPGLIVSLHTAIGGRAARVAPAVAAAPTGSVKPTADQIQRSVADEGITSFIDGKRYKTLKRHLTAHGMYPQSYRARFGLPADYPMVAPCYARRRSALAKAIGLGRPGDQAERLLRDHRAA